MGILCCLDKIQPIVHSSNNNAKLEEIVNYMYDAMSYRVLATFSSKLSDDCYKVDLSVETKTENSSLFIDLGKALIEKTYAKKCDKEGQKISRSVPNVIRVKRESAKPEMPSNAPKAYKELLLEELMDSKRKSLYVQVSHIETSSEFYVKLEASKETDQLRPLMEKIQYFYEKKVNLPQPKLELNTPCVYLDEDKKTWYRAVIMFKVDMNHCIIRLVDYGKSKYVNRAMLRDIYEPFMELPCQVAQASLNDLNDEKDFDEVLDNKFKGLFILVVFRWSVPA